MGILLHAGIVPIPVLLRSLASWQPDRLHGPERQRGISTLIISRSWYHPREDDEEVSCRPAHRVFNFSDHDIARSGSTPYPGECWRGYRWVRGALICDRALLQRPLEHRNSADTTINWLNRHGHRFCSRIRCSEFFPSRNVDEKSRRTPGNYGDRLGLRSLRRLEIARKVEACRSKVDDHRTGGVASSCRQSQDCSSRSCE